ncbi:MAG: hypothetical protein CMH83_10155 [Nocardioides sp.]|nr:hypothetical protein [Nocardioides sp.]
MAGAPGERLPVSFDQRKHVSSGDRAGSWMAISWRLDDPVAHDRLADAWVRVVARHGTLNSVFSPTDVPQGTPVLREVVVGPGEWHEHPVAADADVRLVLRDLLDEACVSYAAPSYRLCLVEPDAPEDGRPVVVIASDHAHVDMWSLLVLARDLLVMLDDLDAGRDPGADLPVAPAFSRHTAELRARPPVPARIRHRWDAILRASGGVMPRFPLPLGDVSEPRPQVVEVRDVLDAEELVGLVDQASLRRVRVLPLVVSVLTTLSLELAGEPLRAVFPVHSRHGEGYTDACGWFITNAVLECEDPDPTVCTARVKEAVALGSWPLADVLAPYGGMPEAPGMFAVSWLDLDRLPVGLDPRHSGQFVSADIRTDGVMIWFVRDARGVHLRCRYPDTPEARVSVSTWLDAVCDRLGALARTPAPLG